MSEQPPGNAGRAEPGLFPEQGAQPRPQRQRTEPGMHADPAAPADVPPDVPAFSAAPEVPQFNAGPDVPRFAMPPAGDGGPAADDDLPPFGGKLPLEPPPPARWGSRLALLGVGMVGLGALAAALLWFNGQRNVDRSFEVLAMSSRAPDGAARAEVPVPAPVPAPVSAPVPAPAPAPAPAPVQHSAPEPVPPLVTLPPEEVGARRPRAAVAPATAATPVAKSVAKPAKKVAASAPGKNVRKAAAKTGAKPVAKVAKKKKNTAAARKAARTALAPRPIPRVPVQQRRCKRGELARECLGLKG